MGKEDDYNPDSEIQLLRKTLAGQSQLSAVDADQISFKMLVTEAKYLKCCIISCTLFFFMAWGGINGVLFYVQVIFADSGVGTDPGAESSRKIFPSYFSSCQS